jgi:diacylglycerol O-acyltransferase / wax synthase
MREERPMHAERRMSDVEAMMWNLEKDPFLSSTFGSISILDRPPDYDRLARRMEYVLSTVPRLRQRVVPALGRLAPPEWQDDPELDLRYHVRRVALPEGATMRDLYDFATLFIQDPFDRTRPLWEFLAIEGLPGGKGALLQKMHHTITDGEGGIRMSERMVDLTRDATDPEPVPIEEVPPLEADLLSTTIETLGHSFRRAGGIAERSLAWAAGSITDPARVYRLGFDVTEVARSAARQLIVTDGAHSPLWTRRTLNRWFDTLDVSFDDAKRAAKTLGGSLNDLFVAGAATGAGEYHRRKGVEVVDLRMAMPVSFRRDKTAGGNSFAPMRVVVPVAGDDIVARFGAIRDRLTTTKGEKAIGLVGGVAGIVNLMPTSALVRFTRQQVEAIDFATSNVRAAPFDLYISGGRVEGNYPLGPLSGTAFNLTMMSYCGTLNMGLHVDRGAIEEPELLRSCLEDAYAELIAAGT